MPSPAHGETFSPWGYRRIHHFCGWTARPKQMYMESPYGPESSIDAFYHGKRPGSETWIDFDEAATQNALDWLKEKPKGPWCCWVPLIFPHLPFEVEDPWYSMYAPNVGCESPRAKARISFLFIKPLETNSRRSIERTGLAGNTARLLRHDQPSRLATWPLDAAARGDRRDG